MISYFLNDLGFCISESLQSILAIVTPRRRERGKRRREDKGNKKKKGEGKKENLVFVHVSRVAFNVYRIRVSQDYSFSTTSTYSKEYI